MPQGGARGGRQWVKQQESKQEESGGEKHRSRLATGVKPRGAAADSRKRSVASPQGTILKWETKARAYGLLYSN